MCGFRSVSRCRFTAWRQAGVGRIWRSRHTVFGLRGDGGRREDSGRWSQQCVRRSTEGIARQSHRIAAASFPISVMGAVRPDFISGVIRYHYRPAGRFVLLPNINTHIPPSRNRVGVVDFVPSHQLIDAVSNSDATLSGVQQSIASELNIVCPVIGDQATAGAAVAPRDEIVLNGNVVTDPEVDGVFLVFRV